MSSIQATVPRPSGMQIIQLGVLVAMIIILWGFHNSDQTLNDRIAKTDATLSSAHNELASLRGFSAQQCAYQAMRRAAAFKHLEVVNRLSTTRLAQLKYIAKLNEFAAVHWDSRGDHEIASFWRRIEHGWLTLADLDEQRLGEDRAYAKSAGVAPSLACGAISHRSPGLASRKTGHGASLQPQPRRT